MNSRQIINAIHEGWPIEKDESPEAALVPDKRKFGSDFAKAFSHFDRIAEHSVFQRSQKETNALQHTVKTATSIKTLVNHLHTSTVTALRPLGSAYIRQLKKEMPEEYTMIMKQLWEREQNNHPGRMEDILIKDHPEETLARHQELLLGGIVAGGIRNVAYHTWGLLCATPAVQQREMQTVVQPEEWSAIGESTLSLTQALSSSNLKIFDHGIQPALWAKQPPQKEGKGQRPWSHLSPFHPEMLTLHESSIHLAENMIQKARQKLQRLMDTKKLTLTEKRAGCAGMDMFPVIHQHIMKDAENCLFPYADHITSLPLT